MGQPNANDTKFCHVRKTYQQLTCLGNKLAPLKMFASRNGCNT